MSYIVRNANIKQPPSQSLVNLFQFLTACSPYCRRRGLAEPHYLLEIAPQALDIYLTNQLHDTSQPHPSRNPQADRNRASCTPRQGSRLPAHPIDHVLFLRHRHLQIRPPFLLPSVHPSMEPDPSRTHTHTHKRGSVFGLLLTAILGDGPVALCRVRILQESRPDIWRGRISTMHAARAVLLSLGEGGGVSRRGDGLAGLSKCVR